MQRLPRLLVVLALGLPALLHASLGPASLAQDKKEKEKEKDAKGEKVHFPTSDGVDLHGVFYPGKATLPTVLFLHSLGEDSKKRAWVHLAEELHGLGFAVLAFDFRGHGASKDLVEPKLFWKNQENASQIKGP